MSKGIWKFSLIALLLVALVAFMAACGDDDDDDDTGDNGATTEETATTSNGSQTATEGEESATETEEENGGEAAMDTGVTEDSIKLGGSYPYSGNASAYGTIGHVIEAYFKMVNEKGGVNGRQIEFTTLDDAYSPDRTFQNTRQLVEEDKVFAIFNTLGTPPNSAIWDYMNEQEVPQIFVATGAAKWDDPEGHPWTMGWQPNYVSEGKVYAQYVLDNVPDAKIAVLYQNDDYGKDYLNGLKEGLGDQAEDMIVQEISYEVTAATVNAEVTQLADSGANVFYLAATPKFATQAIVQAHQVGWTPVILLNSVSSSVGAVVQPAIDSGGPEVATNLVTTFYVKDPTDPQWADDKAVNDFKAFMEQYYPEGNIADAFNIYGYSVAQTMVHVLEMCGENLTRENLMKQAASLKDYRIDTLLPGITLNTSADDFAPIEAMQVAKWAGDTWQLEGDVIDVSGGGAGGGGATGTGTSEEGD
jgi:branched-chain amino acid transport system substrate-binding protein